MLNLNFTQTPGESTSRFILKASFNVGLNAKAGLATAIIWPPAADITWTPPSVVELKGFESTGRQLSICPKPWGEFDGLLAVCRASCMGWCWIGDFIADSGIKVVTTTPLSLNSRSCSEPLFCLQLEEYEKKKTEIF